MLVNSRPPDASLDVLSRELAEAARDGRLAAYLEQPVRPGQLGVTAPHPFFVLDVEDLSDVDDDDLAPAAAISTGWRYLLELNQRVVALVTTDVDAAGNHRFGGVGTGPSVSSVVYAVHIADGLLRSRPEEFRIAAIDLPAVHTVLLQVSDPAGERLAYLPVGLGTSLHPARLHTRAEVRRHLRAAAPPPMRERVGGEPIGG